MSCASRITLTVLLTDCTGQAKLLLLLLRLRLLRCSVLPAPFNGALARPCSLLILNNSFINFNTPRVVMSCPTTQPEKACKKMPLNVPNPYHILFSGGFPFLKIGVISKKTKFFLFKFRVVWGLRHTNGRRRMPMHCIHLSHPFLMLKEFSFLHCTIACFEIYRPSMATICRLHIT